MSAISARPLATALGGLLAMASAVGVGRFVLTPILPFMEAGFGLAKSASGLIASANYLGYLVGALIASLAALPGSRRGWVFAALALSAVTTGALGVTGTMAGFIALRFIGGLASSVVLVFASTLVLERLAAAGATRLSAIHFAGVGCGIAASAVLVAGLATYRVDWPNLWLASGMLAAPVLFAVITLVPSAEDAATGTAADNHPMRRNRPLLLLIASYGLVGFGYVITVTFISTMVLASPAISAIEPVVWLVVGLSAAPSVALWVWLGRRWSNPTSFALACLAEAFGVALSVLVAAPWAVLLGAALLGGTFMGMTALGLIQARALASGDPRRGLALMTASFGLGQMVGSAFAGLAHGIADSFVLPSMTAAAALVLAAVPANRAGGP
jgi:predicted MFS family arabinose efflux permease